MIVQQRFDEIYIVGDSHVLPFSKLCFSNDEISKDTFLIKDKYIKAFSMSLFKEENKITNLLFRSFIDWGIVEIVNEKIRSTRTPVTDNEKNVARARSATNVQPIVLISIGDIDLRSIFLKKYHKNLERLFFENNHGAIVEMFREHFANTVPSFFRLANKLNKFCRLIILGAPISYANDKKFLELNEYHLSIKVRSHLANLFNLMLEQNCRSNNIIFFNPRHLLIHKDETFKKEYALEDGIHYSKDAALVIINSALTHYYKVKANKEKYVKLWSINSSNELPSCLIDGVKTIPSFLDKNACLALINNMNWSLSFSNEHRRRDWEGNPAKAEVKNIFTANPPNTVLKDMFNFFYDEKNFTKLKNLFGFPFTILTCRPIRSIPHNDAEVGPQAFHTDYNPPGLVRGILYLNNVERDEGHFEYLASDGGVQPVTGHEGTLVIFDANGYKHRASIPKSKERYVLDLLFCPLIPGMEKRIIWPGMNHWPVDPFHFSLYDYKIYPPIQEGVHIY